MQFIYIFNIISIKYINKFNRPFRINFFSEVRYVFKINEGKRVYYVSKKFIFCFISTYVINFKIYIFN